MPACIRNKIGKRQRWFWCGISAAVLVLLLVISFTGCGSRQNNSLSGDEFTIVALPDTQYYSRDFPQIFQAQTQWIADHVQDQNIKLVLGLGDIVDDGADPAQWQNADMAVHLLDGQVPYLMAIGNHDYANAKPAARTGGAAGFNQFFGPSRYAGASWYKGNYQGSNENFYGVININGRDFLILVLEYAPRDAALKWADGILKANQDKEAIIVTHSFTFTDNTRISRCDANSASSFGVGQDNDGEDMWWKLVRKYANVRMVLSGHVNTGDGTGHRVDLGANGNLVNQMLSDYQSEPLGGGGYLRILKISPSLNQITVSTYSPYLDSFKTDDHNQFTVPYTASGGLVSGAISGKVQDVVTCQPVGGVNVAITGGSAITAADGTFSMSAPAVQSVAITASKSGMASDSRFATSTADSSLPSPTKIFVASSGHVTGFIDTGSGAGVSGATVTFSGGDLRFSTTVTTDGHGGFDSGPIGIGQYTVSVSAAGHSGASASTSVAAGSSVNLDVTLK
ncbi:MAG TPA: carboxypeptidase regulatory-like domain-containing protein [Candidatus Angelobacter sp.]|nr:carboxypeptidase regulatory-like domain-containing protein [Candidatus Angelobacter sp.]